ncbi:SPOR domain-containing protein [Brachybacterium sp. GCM10030267]|uniref:SPOR domain-containing protein n=1 Tax=unclassified Brachybacterium TaxID=2623841 RepID=UPI0036063515
MTEGTEFYYNLTTGNVEEGRQSPGTELMGPYSTRAEAEKALKIAAARNEAWQEEDQEWEDYGGSAEGSEPKN